MSENAVEGKTYTAEELKQMWDSLTKDFQDAITKVNDQIDEHNANVALIKASKESDHTKLLSEIREQNPHGDAKLEAFNAEITKLNERIEQIVKKANEVAKQYLPESVTEEQVAKATEETKASASAIRDAIKGIETFETLMPTLVLSPHIKEAQSTRGLALIGSRGGIGEGTKRPRMSAIYLGDELIEKEVQTSSGKQKKSTLNILAAELNKRLETKKFNTTIIQEAYFKAVTEATGSRDNVPDEVTFTLPYTYTTEQGNEQTEELHIKVVK